MGGGWVDASRSEDAVQISRFMTRHPITVGPDDPVERAVALMEQHGFRHLPVQDGDEFVGMLSDRDVMLGTGGQALAALGLSGDENVVHLVRDIMSQPVLSVSADERAAVAARRMVKNRIGALPVLEDGEPAGIITETNLCKAFADVCRDPSHADVLDADVESVMRPSTIVLAPGDSVSDAVELLTDWSIRHVPVLHEEELVGIVSDRDVRLAVGRDMVADALAQREGRVHVDVARVESIMSREVLTAEPTDRLSEAVQIMLASHVSALPVCLQGMLLGIVTRTDVLEHYADVA